MLTLKQVKNAINRTLLSKFPDIEIQSTDVEEGFMRPSFFVQLDNIDRDTRLNYSIRSMTTRIYYFPSDRYEYSLEVMDIQDQLESVFNLNFTAEGRVITIDETRGQLIDGVLEFEFDFTYYDNNIREDAGALMEELELSRDV